jgi:N-acyl-L-homoserine lactone synthetase
MEQMHSELYFKTASTDLELQQCYRMRYQVYCEEKRWLSTRDFPNGMEKDFYDENAVHVMAFDNDFRLVGLMRILQKKDFKVLPFEKHPAMKGKAFMAPDVAELSRLIVTAKKNRMDVTKGLLRAVYQTSRQMGIENWTIVIEPSLMRLLGIFDFVLEPLSLPAKYFGGFTQVALANISRSEKMWHEIKPQSEAFYQSEAAILRTALVG